MAYTRIELLRDIYEYNKEMRQYEEDYRKYINNKAKEMKHDSKQEAGRDRKVHHEYIREPDSVDSKPLG